MKSLFVMFLMSALLIPGCGTANFARAQSGSGAPLDGEIAIGAVWSLTGAAAAYGPQQKKAAEMAVNEINKAGTPGRAKIKLITEDDRSTKEGAISAFETVIKKDKVIAILGPTLSNSAKAADPIAQESKVVVLATSNTVSGVVDIGNFIFRDSLPESAVQPNTIKVTQDKLAYKKVAVMYGNDDAFTKGGYDVFKQVLEKRGIQILTTETFQKNDTDFSAQLTKIKGYHPDAIIVSALAEEAAGIMSQGLQLGIPEKVPFIGGNGFNSPKLPQLGGQFAEGAISGCAWLITNSIPGNKEFVHSYKTAYGSDPDQFAAQAYAGVHILAEAIKKAGSKDPTAIRDALAGIRDFNTILGKFSFDPGRNPIYEPIVQVIKNGKFELFR